MIRNAQHEDSTSILTTGSGASTSGGRIYATTTKLYCLGHLLELVVAFEIPTGNGRLLEVAVKVCEQLDSVFGLEPEKKRGYPGHQEIKIGLLKLFELTKDELHLKLDRHFILKRGQQDESGDTYFDNEAKARSVRRPRG